MFPTAPQLSGVYAPAQGTMADYNGRFNSFLQGTRGIKRPSASMTGVIPLGSDKRIASNDTSDTRVVKTVPYAIHVVGDNVPGYDFRADGIPLFIRDAAIYSKDSMDATSSAFNTDSAFNPAGINVGGLFNHPYRTSYRAFSLQQMNLIQATLEGPAVRGKYASARDMMTGFSYAGPGINQQGGVSKDWSKGKEYSREKQINVAKWGIAVVFALWGHYPKPGDNCYLINKRFKRNEQDKYNIHPDSRSALDIVVDPSEVNDYPFRWVPWSGPGLPTIYDTYYPDPAALKRGVPANRAPLVPGAVVFVGQFEYSIESGTTRMFDRAATDARVAADTGLTRMTVFPGGIKFDF